MKINLNAVRESTPTVLSQEELNAIQQVLDAGAAHGYGNMMAWLAAAWASQLHKDGMSLTAASKLVSSRSHYPLDWIKP